MKRIYFVSLVALLLLTQAVWNDAPTHAATRLTVDLTDLFKSAELVVDAEVLTRKAGGMGIEGLPVTAVSLKVNRVFKGNGAAAGEALDAEYLGGSNGEVQTVVPGQPNLAPGSHVVVLLSKFGRTPHWRVIGGDAGEIDFVFGDDGRPLARRTCGANFDYYVRDEHSLTGFQPVSAAALNEAQFLQLFEALASTGRPVVELPATRPTAQSITTAAPESKPTSVSARPVDDDAPMALAAVAQAPAGNSLFQRALLTLVLVALAWVVGLRSISSLKELNARRK